MTTLVVPLGARGPEEAGSESQASLLYLSGCFPLLIRDRPTQAVHVPGICFLSDYLLASTANCRAMSSWENQGHRLAGRLPEKSDSSASSWPVAPLGHVTALTNVTKKSQGRKVIHGSGLEWRFLPTQATLRNGRKVLGWGKARWQGVRVWEGRSPTAGTCSLSWAQPLSVEDLVPRPSVGGMHEVPPLASRIGSCDHNRSCASSGLSD